MKQANASRDQGARCAALLAPHPVPLRGTTLSPPVGGERGNEKCLVLLALLLLTSPLFANVTSSSLTGRVNVGGKAVAGVTVTAASSALQQPRTTTSDARGRYWIDALPPGEYDVTFSLAGHNTLTRRAVLELARVARADATLEPNADEESVTSTATTPSVADTIPATTHFDDHALDRLPAGRIGSVGLAPGSFFQGTSSLDGVTTSGLATSEETVEQITVVRAAAPVEWESYGGAVTAVRTRSGSDELLFTLRGTVASSQWNDTEGFPVNDDGTHVFGEATAGGRIVPQRLWFFAAGWSGQQTFGGDFDGALVKADAQLAPAHHLGILWRDAKSGGPSPTFDNDTLAARYTGVAGERFTGEVLADRTQIGSGGYEYHTDFGTARGSYAAGAHVVSAGFTARDGDIGLDTRSWFASDRWSGSRWNLYAGARFDDSALDEQLSARAAVTFDLRGDGVHAIAASYGEYAEPSGQAIPQRIATLGYARAIGTSGTIRIDALQRKADAFWMHQLQADARYRLFDRFEAGATYTLTNMFESALLRPAYPEQDANLWIGAEFPLGLHQLGFTLLQHAREMRGDSAFPTDLALRYTLPVSRANLLLAADATNVFSSSTAPLITPRSVRLWIRVRV